MQSVSAPFETRTPIRAAVTDDTSAILRFAAHELRKGPAALATLVDIRGGAARTLGAHVAIAYDGRFCGYVSGGCVEAALAAEGLMALSEGRDRCVRFGDGSPFFDIELPCGGGVTIAIHVLKEAAALDHVLERLKRRQVASLEYSSIEHILRECEEAPPRAAWFGTAFRTVYWPRTRIVISGRNIEAQMVASLAKASGYDVVLADDAMGTLEVIDQLDPFTAVVLLHHDLDAEIRILRDALSSPAFYIGALGSTRTHKRRVDRLRDMGIAPAITQRIKAPIGLFGPARDATSLALSVLADVAASRLASFP